MLRPRSGSGTAHTAATDTPRRLAGSTNTGCVSFLQTKVRHRVVSGVASSTEECVRLHHRMCPPSLPEEGAEGPAFARLYVVDPNAANNRRKIVSRLECMKNSTSLAKRFESTIKSRRFSNAQCKIRTKRTNQVLGW